MARNLATHTLNQQAVADDLSLWKAEINNAYPDLAGLDLPEWHDALERARPVKAPPHTTLLQPHNACANFMMLLRGRVRVFQPADDGREITLYRVIPGDVCVLSIHGILRGECANVVVESETDILAIGLSAQDFHSLLGKSEVFRNFVLSQLADRMFDVMTVVEDTTFHHLNVRLACLLGRLFESQSTDVLRVTHQMLARELGTTREVISRLLKQFERQGCIKLSRGAIRLESAHSLSGLANVSSV